MTDAIRVDGRVALITGGGGAIGSATGRLLASRGAAVVLADLDLPRAEAAAREIGPAAVAMAVDLADEASIVALVQAVIARFGRLDILHNNAADLSNDLNAVDTDLEHIPTWAWERTYRVNVIGTALLTREALPWLRANGSGSIVNTVSNLALQGHVVQAAYSSSKAAVIQMTRSVAASHGRRGVRCNAVAPGLTVTPAVLAVFPEVIRKLIAGETLRDRLGEPADIAEAVAFLASDAARNITGQLLTADGGLSTHLPAFAGFSALGAP